MKHAPEFGPLYQLHQPGRNAYMLGDQIARQLPDASRSWAVNGEVRSMQHKLGGYIKRLDDFDKHRGDEDTFAEFIRETSAHGSFMPSSYASIFHDQFKSPRVRWTINAFFLPYFRGAWNEARARGASPGMHRCYDINSAYLWASTLGMPVVASYRVERRLSETRPGVYVVTLRENDIRHPYPFSSERTVIATDEEITQLNLGIEKVHYGISYTDCLPEDSCTRIAQDFSFWKQIGRGYWGRWASAQKVECAVASGKTWEIGNPILNIPWASLILARVRMRLWEVSANAIHFYTDSVITRDELPVGSALGQWRHVADFPQGVEIRHAGFYKPLGDTMWLKHAGQPS